MDKKTVEVAFAKIADVMAENRDYLIELDQRNGDGDLGISMSNGFKAAYETIKDATEKDLGKVFLSAAKSFNSSAPSSLGTIISIGLMGMAKNLRGAENFDLKTLVSAMEAGINNIMAKAGSKRGEKTILDALIPAIEALKSSENENCSIAFNEAYKASLVGAEETKNMKSVHGRAAYYAEKSIGLVDGGAVAGTLIFKALVK